MAAMTRAIIGKIGCLRVSSRGYNGNETAAMAALTKCLEVTKIVTTRVVTIVVITMKNGGIEYETAGYRSDGKAGD